MKLFIKPGHKKFFRIFILFFIFSLSFGQLSYAAWQEPTQDPPGGNRPEPLDISATAQTKAGNLTVDDFIADNITSDTITVSNANEAISGETTGVNGLTDFAIHGTALLGGWAGYFQGPVLVEGSLQVGTGLNSLCLNGNLAENCISSWAEVGANQTLLEILQEDADAGAFVGPTSIGGAVTIGGNLTVQGGRITGVQSDEYITLGTIDDNIALYTNNVEVFRIDENQNVGIGTYGVNATQKLEVSEDGRGSARLRITDLDTGQNPELQLKYAVGANDHWAMYVNKDNTDSLNIWGTGDTGTDRLTILASGNVGIGTTTPNQLLHLYRDTGDNAEIDIQSVEGDNEHWAIYQQGRQAGNLDYLNGDLWFWHTGANNLLALTAEGRIGIDQTTPMAKLDVKGNIKVQELNLDILKVNDIVHGSVPADLWLGDTYGYLYSCNSAGDCNRYQQVLGVEGPGDAHGITSMAVFNGRLWLGHENGQLSSCNEAADCTSYPAVDGGNTILAMKVFRNRLWIGHNASGRLYACDSSGVCKDQGVRGLAIYDLEVFNGKLWVSNDNSEVYTCNDLDDCDGPFNVANNNVLDMEIFDGKLWLGDNAGFLYSCDTLDVCTNHGFVGGGGGNGGIYSMAVLNNELWIGHETSFWFGDDGNISSCDNLANCTQRNNIPGNGPIKSVVAYNAKLWIGSGTEGISESLSSCDSSGLCTLHFGGIFNWGSMESMVVYHPASNFVYGDLFVKGDLTGNGDISAGGDLSASGNLIVNGSTFNGATCEWSGTSCDGGDGTHGDGATTPPWETLAGCGWHYADGYVFINRFDCSNNNANYIYNQGPPLNKQSNMDSDGMAFENGEYCNIQCPTGTNMVSGGGCTVRLTDASLHPPTGPPFYSEGQNNPFRNELNGEMGWECLANPGTVVGVWVTCWGPDFSESDGYQCPPVNQ